MVKDKNYKTHDDRNIKSLQQSLIGCLGGSKASQHKIKAQIQYNPLKFQQSSFNHHFKSIEGGQTYKESNTKYVVKVVSVPSSESDSQPSIFENTMDSIKNFLTILYQFMYPYKFSATISASLIAVERLSDISSLFFIGLLQINKPYLPLASGKLSFRNCVFIVASSLILAPFLRWKQYPVVAALFIFVTWTIIFPITYFLHMQTFVLKRPVVFPRSLIVSMLFMAFYSAGIALSKDIPDIEGDKQHGIESFSMRLGQKKVFWICVFLYEMAFGVAFLAGATSSFPFWIKIVTILGSFVLASILWYHTKYVDVTNPASTRSFYSLNWKLLIGAYFLLPLIRRWCH
ncbi:hypothetical protein PHAVU_007G228200 [Phaseolus vulgaris]|uniref:Uncharacterized protein n=1 Tax=Phaseolus vulgaris TaxID=3885 RepID=V7BJU2_PHAVU|nr:hypothetical protein PHAVU_007G228200g [Phaseolus vulgaris]ESW17303.1 hypothetical protein PHAVU_007G228200g [Phaseolus vulgaris]